MTKKTWRSCGAPGEFGLGLIANTLRLPDRHIVKIVRLNLATGQDIATAHNVSVRHLRFDRSLDHANEGLRDAELLCDPCLGAIIDSAPLGKLHRVSSPRVSPAGRIAPSEKRYCGVSYFVNGHD